nr:MAG TPA: hypothetical protein [Caudoviricetes sp.]
MTGFPRGTTPTLKFKLPFGANLLKTILITISQKGYSLINKENADITSTDDTLTVTLTQDETLTLMPGEIAVQIRAVTTGGKAIASTIMTADVAEILKGGVLE